MRTIRVMLSTLLLAALFLCAAPAFGEQNGDALTVGVPVDRCPVFYRDAEMGEIVGIGVDLMRAAAERPGLTSPSGPSRKKR